ncbi:MAG: nucleotidyltransferase domain-containing protein [Caldilineaceae bacterium]|nr:nucleotidyltransferase domain-containing protein [Caldilineaceae bacterium]
MNIDALIHRFHHPTVTAIALFGSHARGDAGPYSDIDFIRFVNSDEADPPGSGSHLIDDTLVVVTNYTPSTVNRWFTDPTAAVQVIAGLRQAKPLWDPNGEFARLQARAHAFTWTDELQVKADLWASEQMVGWIEEVHKGLEGLHRQDVGRLLNASFGLSWGLAGVVKVQRGVLFYSDNNVIDQVMASVGVDTLWSQLCAISFGVGEVHDRPPSLRERVVAGLHLYTVTAELLSTAIQPEHVTMVRRTVDRINIDLEDAYHGEQ